MCGIGVAHVLDYPDTDGPSMVYNIHPSSSHELQGWGSGLPCPLGAALNPVRGMRDASKPLWTKVALCITGP